MATDSFMLIALTKISLKHLGTEQDYLPNSTSIGSLSKSAGSTPRVNALLSRLLISIGRPEERTDSSRVSHWQMSQRSNVGVSVLFPHLILKGSPLPCSQNKQSLISIELSLYHTGSISHLKNRTVMLLTPCELIESGEVPKSTIIVFSSSR